MKALIALSLCITSAALAQSVQRWAPTDTRMNVDGSETIVAPKLFRGNRQYLIYAPTGNGAANYFNGVCKAMGYVSYLPESIAYANRMGDQSASISSNGIFDGLVSYTYTVAAITCHNNNQRVVVTAESFTDNPDGTITAVAPRLAHGNRQHMIYAPTGNGAADYFNGVCKALGYASYLPESIAYANRLGEPSASISSSGTFDGLVSFTYVAREISCEMRSGNVTVLEDSHGNRYFRRP